MLTIESNPNLKVTTIDEKWADVECLLCGQIERIRRTEIRQLNKSEIEVKCHCEVSKDE